MRIGSLFSGYGGLDLAALQLFPGSSVAWHCEWDDAPSKILAHHWPTVPNLRDVTEVDWNSVEPVDILAGGFPCQDVSAAGKRAGLQEGTRSGLWAHFAYAIRRLRPRYVLIENVAGLLTAQGEPDSDELIAANREVARLERALEHINGHKGKDAHHERGRRAAAIRVTRQHKRAVDRRRRADRFVQRAIATVLGTLAEIGYDAQWTSLRASDVGAPHHRERVFILVSAPNADSGERNRDERAQGRIAIERKATAGRGAGFPPDTESQRLPGQQQPERGQAERSVTDGSFGLLPGINWGNYGPAIRRWERLTRPAPAPTRLNRSGKPQLNAEFAEWMMGLPAGHVTAVPGISRAHQLKAIGNGVCPQQAITAYSSLLTRMEVAA
ncbi:DNA (cytosine-5)-methyltransferase 1 [Rhodococcus sp. 27YEA15]|uniref:DNA cytosine methyltransferase n=1 Tax=Rhodococcus sp. 27YEA15 TaxID=3156259 RepID=UPI003C7E87A1